MAEGSIKKLDKKGFGFIKTESNQALFFHSSALQGIRFEELKVGQRDCIRTRLTEVLRILGACT